MCIFLNWVKICERSTITPQQTSERAFLGPPAGDKKSHYGLTTAILYFAYIYYVVHTKLETFNSVIDIQSKMKGMIDYHNDIVNWQE